MSFPRYYGQRSGQRRHPNADIHNMSKIAPTVKTYNTLEAIAAALIAFRKNGNKIEKYDAAEFTLYDNTDNNRPTVRPAVVANKTHALAVMADTTQITQADKDTAQEIMDYLNGQVTMSVLSGKKVSDFVRDLVATFEADTVPQFKLGLLLYAPNAWHTGRARDTVTEETTECLYTSQPLGHVGDKVTVNFTMLDKRYIQTLDCFAVYGKDDKGDLVSFLTKHEKLATSGMIVGKVKGAGNDQWHNNAMVTSLNYVKAS
jgi:hypothetical protein